jgi:hypothetical protein
MEQSALRTTQVQQSTQPFALAVDWVIGVVSLGIANVERKERSQRHRKLLKRVREAIVQEMSCQIEAAHLFSLLNTPAEDVARDYNSRISAVLRRYRSLQIRPVFVDLLRAQCKIPGWFVCSKCGKLFKLPGTDGDICSDRCKKNLRNRREWLRRSAQVKKWRTTCNMQKK